MAYSKHIVESHKEFAQISRLNLPLYERVSSPPSPKLPLPGMSVFSSKRRYSDIDIVSTLPNKIPKLAPPPVSSSHNCTRDCTYCASLTNLDIAAYYWSMLAMRNYTHMKSTALRDFTSLPPVPSPTNSCDVFTFSKPPSPSGSLSSVESEPLSPSNSLTSETLFLKDTLSYQCQICQKNYSHPRLLNRHMQSHTPYKKHHCPRCRKGFNDAFDLKRHIRTHTGIKPFDCNLCDKSFTQVCYFPPELQTQGAYEQPFDLIALFFGLIRLFSDG